MHREALWRPAPIHTPRRRKWTTAIGITTRRACRSYNQAAGTFAKSGSATPVLIANLNYSRGIADDPDPSVTGDEVSADWMRWTSKFDTSNGGEGFPVHPQPWLTSIAFDGNAM